MMIEEINIYGVYIPAALLWAIIAGIASYSVRNLLQRLPVDYFLWQPGLLDLTLFLLFWWGLVALSDMILPLLNMYNQ